MEISVVIPTFNRAELTLRALRSVQKQTHAPAEIIVVDDGSACGEVDNIISEFPETIVVTQENCGVSSARNAGIRMASSEWIAFLDSDDQWLPQKLARQVSALEREPDYKACHTDEIWIRNGIRVNPRAKHAKRGGWIYQHCLPLCCVSPSSVLMTRETLLNAGLFDESLPACEDYDLWLRLFSRIPVLLVKEQLLVKHGGHQDQLSRKYWGMDRFRVRALVNILENGELDARQTTMTRDILLGKLKILMSGLRKRNKLESLSH